MKFHLNHNPKSSPVKISHKDVLLLTGSCFSENIGRILHEYKFRTLNNPGGIVFNPLSIVNLLQLALDKKIPEDDLIINREGIFLSYLHHSSVAASSREDLKKKLSDVASETLDFIKKADFLFITFGTAKTYTLALNKKTVANCHKQNAQEFTERRLEVEEITKCYASLIQKLHVINPDLKIIFTVSPVKYLREGVEENSLSKATLLLAVHKIINENKNCFYFPAYELVNDDLRDYRFYKEDLAHPSEQAIEYVWQKFSDSFFDDQTIKLNAEIKKLNQARSHRRMNGPQEDDEKLQQFIRAKEREIMKIFPHLEL